MIQKIKGNKLIIFLCIMICSWGGFILISCIEKLDPTGDPGAEDGPFPTDDIILELTSVNGDYEASANGQDSIQFEAFAHKADGTPWRGIELSFSATYGGWTQPLCTTNQSGKCYSDYLAGCIPGTDTVWVSAPGTNVFEYVELYGQYPDLRVEADDQNIGGSGYIIHNRITARFQCDDDVFIPDVEVQFEAELGCFEHDVCPIIQGTDAEGIASIFWWPQSYGTYRDFWSDWNEPKSVVVTATYVVNDVPDESIQDKDTIWIYPLHAKAWVDGAELSDDGRYLICADDPEDFHGMPVIVKVYWYDAHGQYPQKGITVQVHDDTVVTGSDGYAISYIVPNGYDASGAGNHTYCSDLDPEDFTPGTIEVSISETGPPDCCYDNSPSVWEWNYDIPIKIVYVPPTPTPVPTP